LDLNNGNQNNNNKTNNNRVRAFRKWLIIQTILVLPRRGTFSLPITIVATRSATHGAPYGLKNA